MAEEYTKTYFKILTLDGGGSKGFYSLGVLKELEALFGQGRALYQNFDLIYGTSTGAIIASLLALGYRADDIYKLYKEHVPTVMCEKRPAKRTEKLKELADKIYGDMDFSAFKMNIGIVATDWLTQTPRIFKRSIEQAYGRQGTFAPGFGCPIKDAVIASCSAYPYFEIHKISSTTHGDFECVDGGFCANNPALYAIADAVKAFGIDKGNIRLISIGVGNYVPPPTPPISKLGFWFASRLFGVQIDENTVNKIFNVNSSSFEQLRTIYCNDIQAIRINESNPSPEVAVNLLESDLTKLEKLYQLGQKSFGQHEADIKRCFF